MEFNNKGVGLSSLGHWANGIKEDGLTGFGFLTRECFTLQGSQIGNK